MGLSANDRARICKAARSYIGTPWMVQGRTHLGMDCCGMIVVPFRDAGFDVEEDKPDYQRLDPKRLMRMLLSYCAKIGAQENPLPADIALYGLPNNEAHVALLVDGSPLNIVHAPFGHPVCETRFDTRRGPLRGIYRWQS